MVPDELAHYAKAGLRRHRILVTILGHKSGREPLAAGLGPFYRSASGQDLSYVDQNNTKERYIPWITVETSGGVGSHLLNPLDRCL